MDSQEQKSLTGREKDVSTSASPASSSKGPHSRRSVRLDDPRDLEARCAFDHEQR